MKWIKFSEHKPEMGQMVFISNDNFPSISGAAKYAPTIGVYWYGKYEIPGLEKDIKANEWEYWQPVIFPPPPEEND